MMEAVILAAGLGRGLEPVTHTRHKVLVPVINQPLLNHHFKALRKAGIDKVIVVVSYRGDEVRTHARELSERYGVDVKIVEQGSPQGTGHALLKALDYVSSDRFLTMYGDVFYEDADIAGIVNKGCEVIAAYRVKDPQKYGVIMHDDGLLRKVVEKPVNPASNLVNAGIYVLKKDIVKFLENLSLSPRGEYELTDAVNSYVASGGRVKVFELSYWTDVGRPWKLLELNKYLLSRLPRRQVIKGRVEEGVRIKGPVIIEEGAEVRSGTYIIGPAYIDRDATIGPNAFIRPYSIILREAHIGFNVEVKESIVMEKTHIAHQAYVGDSIVCEESNLGAGTILANLRFDDRNVRCLVKGRLEDSGRRKLGAIIGGHVKTGVNVSTVPGVKIGAYSWINPGLTIYRDVPPCIHVVSNNEFKPVKGACGVDLNVWRP